MTVCICFPYETSALIEIGTHQEVKFLSTTGLFMLPWRQKFRTANELDSYKLTSEELKELAVKDTTLPKHVLSPTTALI